MRFLYLIALCGLCSACTNNPPTPPKTPADTIIGNWAKYKTVFIQETPSGIDTTMVITMSYPGSISYAFLSNGWHTATHATDTTCPNGVMVELPYEYRQDSLIFHGQNDSLTGIYQNCAIEWINPNQFNATTQYQSNHPPTRWVESYMRLPETP